MNSKNLPCQNCKQLFSIEHEDFQFYERIQVPAPTWCPDCRAARRMIFWNEHFLFRKKEEVEGREVFSTYPEEAKIKIYDHDYWWSDKWNPLAYGRDYDFSRGFFEQYREMIYEMPWPARSIRGMVNSDYCNQASYLKNCYLCFNCENAEDCLYAVGFKNSKSSMDFYWSIGAELSYELTFCGSMYQSFFSSECDNCQNVWFSRNCDNCTDCFGCVGLKHKSYHIFNKPYSKEEYLKKFKEFNLGSHQSLIKIREEVKRFWLKLPVKYAHSSHNVDVVGDYVYGSRNVKYVFQGSNMDNVRYSQNLGFDIKDSYDYTNWGETSELIYESGSTGDHCRSVKFSFDCWPGCQDLEYCISCNSSANLLGCFGLKKKQYYILNKEYSKKEYEKLRAKIIEHMNETPYISEVRSGKSEVRKIVYKYGEFFPPEFSPLAYNETAAQDYFPLGKEKAEAQGFLWREPRPREYKITLPADKLPDHINDADESVTKETIGCLSCQHPYRILARELEFYKRFGLPLPRLCPNCRHLARTSMRNPLKWYKRNCMCAGEKSSNNVYANTATHTFHDKSEHCLNKFETSYSQERPEIVYCESCYNAETA